MMQINLMTLHVRKANRFMRMINVSVDVKGHVVIHCPFVLMSKSKVFLDLELFYSFFLLNALYWLF